MIDTTKKLDERYFAMSKVPSEMLKKIEFGKLNGKSTINPQWKIEQMTTNFGLCGIGWRFEKVKEERIQLDDGQVMILMEVALFTYNEKSKEWSQPITGLGGDFLVMRSDKKGLIANEDAMKGCLTDALGNAMKYLGVGGDVYKGINDSKYAKRAEVYSREQVSKGKEKTSQKSNMAVSAEKKAVNDTCLCSECGKEVSEKVADFSKKKFKKILCMECQKQKG